MRALASKQKQDVGRHVENHLWTTLTQRRDSLILRSRKRVTMTDSELGEPRVVKSPGPGSIMAVAAHPDDIERWSAGTLAHAIDMGASHGGSSGGVRGAR